MNPMSLHRTLHRAGIVVACAALLVAALGVKPALAAATPWPDPPNPINQDDQKTDKKKTNKNDKNDKSGAIELKERQLAEEKFRQGYHAAYELIMAGHYEAGIVALHALGRDEHPDVANYIGYSYRRMGNYEQSKVWYEKALAANPDHVRTWSYYGMWQMEQGNRLKAEDDLQKVKLLCGSTDCAEYKQLKAVIDGTASY